MKLTKKQYLRTYYLNNRERLINYGKNYYKTHQQKCRLNNIRWKQNNIPGYKKPPTFKKNNEQIILTFD
tara:strand:- start:228 stop:434 length:207 start_codon:yes stop_codon:yes gene_type:complete